jgi:hypothetical protein
MYKNLHLSYLQLANDVFGDEDNNNISVIKEFERFGDDIGMFNGDNYNKIEEYKYSSILKRKFKFDLKEKNDIKIERKLFGNDSRNDSWKKGKKNNEILEIQSKNSEEIIDYSKENSRNSSFRRNKRENDINTLSSHSKKSYSNKTYENYNNDGNENEYKPNSHKGKRRYGN